MKVTIITAVLNRRNTIRKCIRSVINQDYDDIEYIIMDGGSTDGTCDEIAKYLDRITHFVSEKDTGLYAALNRGIEMSKGDIIGLAHSDDELFSDDVISSVVKAFKETDADIIYGNGIYVNANTGRIIRIWNSGRVSRLKLFLGWLPLHPTVFIRRSVFDRIGLYNEAYKIAADTDLLIRMLFMYRLHACWLDCYVVKMNTGGLSTSHRFMLRKWREDYHIFHKYSFIPWLMLPAKIIFKVPQLICKRMRKKGKVYEARKNLSSSTAAQNCFNSERGGRTYEFSARKNGWNEPQFR